MIFIINSTSVAIVKTNDEQLEDIFEKKKKSAVLIKKVSSYYRRFQTLTNISIYFMSFFNAFLFWRPSGPGLLSLALGVTCRPRHVGLILTKLISPDLFALGGLASSNIIIRDRAGVVGIVPSYTGIASVECPYYGPPYSIIKLNKLSNI